MRASAGLLAVFLVGAVAAGAGAVTISFEDVVEFDRDGQARDNKNQPWRTYQAVPDLLAYVHTVSFNPLAASVAEAELLLSHKGNDHREKDTGKGSGFKPAELWFLSGASGVLIGQLEKSQNQWVDQVFQLDPALLAGVGGTSWTLGLRLWEGTSGTDWLWVDRSVLRGTYVAASPVPEPGSLVLLASGLLGLAAAGRRRPRRTAPAA